MEKTFVIKLVLGSEDGPAAFEYFQESVQSLLNDFTSKVFEDLGINHPVNVELLEDPKLGYKEDEESPKAQGFNDATRFVSDPRPDTAGKFEAFHNPPQGILGCSGCAALNVVQENDCPACQYELGFSLGSNSKQGKHGK